MRHGFNVVKVNVGNFDRNLDLTKRFGNPVENGIPAAVLVSPDKRIDRHPPVLSVMPGK